MIPYDMDEYFTPHVMEICNRIMEGFVSRQEGTDELPYFREYEHLRDQLRRYQNRCYQPELSLTEPLRGGTSELRRALTDLGVDLTQFLADREDWPED